MVAKAPEMKSGRRPSSYGGGRSLSDILVDTDYFRSCREENRPLSTQSVEFLSIQSDYKTWCFGPNSFYYNGAEEEFKVDESSCKYVWTPQTSGTIPQTVTLYSGMHLDILIKRLAKYLPRATFNTYVLMCGKKSVIEWNVKPK